MKLTFPLGNIFHRLRKKVWIRLPPLLLPRPQMAWGRRRSLASWTPHCQVRSFVVSSPLLSPVSPKPEDIFCHPPSCLQPFPFHLVHTLTMPPVPFPPKTDHVASVPSFYVLLRKKKKHFELNYDALNYMEKMCCSETIKSRTIWHRWLCNYPHVALLICIWNSPQD